jgi:hypothetical protein
MYKYEWAKIVLVKGDLYPKLWCYRTCKFSREKNLRLQHQIQAVILEVTSCRITCNFFIKNELKCKILWIIRLYFELPAFQSMGSFGHMATSKISSKIAWKMTLMQEEQNIYNFCIQTQNCAALIFLGL